MDPQQFTAFMQRVRSGDQQAAAELVQQYEPEIRREIRLRLRDPRLRQNFDSQDVSQSVLASFFVRAALGQFDFDQPAQLLKLLMTMTRNKLASRVRQERRLRRDYRRLEPGAHAKLSKVVSGSSPSEAAAANELLGEFRARLSEEERRLADLRAQGLEWAQIAAQLNETPEACRKQLARGIDRISRELGLVEIEL